ncbi:MAG: hypothetical protein ABR912_03380 [Terracidiphilus sp.]
MKDFLGILALAIMMTAGVIWLRAWMRENHVPPNQPTPVNPPAGLSEFESWTANAGKAIGSAQPGEPQDATLGIVVCGHTEIGDRSKTEPACSSALPVHVGPQDLEFLADWSMEDSSVWHADVDLKTDRDPDCRQLTSAVEVLQKKNENAFAVLCRARSGDEILLLRHEDQVHVGHVSAGFLHRYPQYFRAALGDYAP